jgi:hypothetical protein
MKLSLAICFSSAGAACHHQMLAMDQDVRLGSRSKLSLPDDYAARLVAPALEVASPGIARSRRQWAGL